MLVQRLAEGADLAQPEEPKQRLRDRVLALIELAFVGVFTACSLAVLVCLLLPIEKYRAWAKFILQTLHQNWIGALLLLTPLVYLELKSLLRRTRKGPAGLEFDPPPSPDERENPKGRRK